MSLLRELRTALRALERDGVYGARVVLGRDELVLYNAPSLNGPLGVVLYLLDIPPNAVNRG